MRYDAAGLKTEVQVTFGKLHNILFIWCKNSKNLAIVSLVCCVYLCADFAVQFGNISQVDHCRPLQAGNV